MLVGPVVKERNLLVLLSDQRANVEWPKSEPLTMWLGPDASFERAWRKAAPTNAQFCQRATRERPEMELSI